MLDPSSINFLFNFDYVPKQLSVKHNVMYIRPCQT